MSAWTVVKVGEVARQIRGVTYSKDEAIFTARSGYTLLLRANNITSRNLILDDVLFVPDHRVSPAQKLVLGDVVIATSSGSLDVVGKTASVVRPIAGTFGAFCKVLRPTKKVDPRYFAHFFLTPRYRSIISSLAAGANINNLRNEHLDDLDFPLPPLAEQKRIASVLDQADNIRRKRSDSINIMSRLPQAIFEEMFGRSSPQPRVWPQVTLADVVRSDDRINYGVVQPGGESELGIPLVRVGNIVDGDFSPGSLKKIEPSIEAQYKRSRLHGDEILIACVGSIGAVAFATPALAGANIARAVARIRLDEKKADRNYIAEFLRLDRTQEYFCNETRAVAQPTLNIKQLSETPLPLPPIAIQKEFAKRVLASADLRSSCDSHLTKLDALFASLQHRAFRGELTCKTAERELAEIG